MRRERREAMISIDAFRDADLPLVIDFVEAIQEHERQWERDLKSRSEIGNDYARLLVCNVAQLGGAILIARSDRRAIGFVCAWVEQDDDLLLSDEHRRHAHISDIFVAPDWRGRGVAVQLADAIEREMTALGCRRVRVCAKAANQSAAAFYRKAGFRPREIDFEKPLAPRA
jgi:ribosomal protein S18 acetylase RimI-like enzyme